MRAGKKVLLVGGLDRSLLNFRGELIRDMVAAGNTVVASAPAEHADVPRAIAELGARYSPITLNRTSLNPFGELAAQRSVRALVEQERPDVILAYTIKPVLHSMTAGQRAGVGARFALITGLGAAFHSPNLKGRLLAFAATIFYRRALRHCTGVFVQNGDIADFLLRKGIVRSVARMTLVRGSGVDVRHYCEQPLAEGSPSFLLLGRLLRDKGVLEFVEAARALRKRMPHARFVLAGDLDPNPASIAASDLEAWRREGVVEYRPFMRDVRPALRECSVFVLPSYHEGMPRSVLEAMASGRAVITTDAIGCRDTIFDLRPAEPGVPFQVGSNGLLVPVRSAVGLAAAMQRLAEESELARAMGRRGRYLALEHFDVRKVNAAMLRVMELDGFGESSVHRFPQ